MDNQLASPRRESDEEFEATEPQSDWHDRFTTIRKLDGGGQAETLLARDERTQELVVIKQLPVARAKDWKSLQLFEREARTLASLQHPSIPALVCAKVDDDPDGDSPTFSLVHRYVEGEPLSELVARGVLEEADARAVARSVLEVLAYLHGRTPPIVHRDIKPSNLVRRPDGGISLIDFGALQQVQRSALTVGSTIIGTPGFVAPEQMMGRALPASDLYGLGATIVQLLSGRDPSDLPSRGQRIDFRPYVHVSPAFAGFLSRLLAPSLDDRFRHAAEALAVLSTLPPVGQQAPGEPPATPAPANRITWPVTIARGRLVVAAVGVAGMALIGALWASGVVEQRRSPASLVVDARLPSGQRVPNTHVIIDGVLVCTEAPCHVGDCGSGRHSVRVEAPGHSVRNRETVVDEGQTAHVVFGL